MMNLQKFVISFLNEFCVKTNWPTPKYDVIAQNNGFLCKLKLKDLEATGEGASKKIARQMSAFNMWKKILNFPVIRAILNQSDDAASLMPTSSKGTLYGEIQLLSVKQRKKLRELLVIVSNSIKNEPFSIAETIPIPKPTPIPISKKFPARFGSIGRTMELPFPDDETPLKTWEPKIEKTISQARYNKPKSSVIPKKLPERLGSFGGIIELPYPDDEETPAEKATPAERATPAEKATPFERKTEKTNESSPSESLYRYIRPGCSPQANVMHIKLSDHNYFNKFPKELKDAAFKVINSKDYKTKKEQAVALLAALQLDYTMSAVPCKNPKNPIVKVELHCDYNGLFMEFKSNIYAHIIDYLNDMLQ